MAGRRFAGNLKHIYGNISYQNITTDSQFIDTRFFARIRSFLLRTCFQSACG